MTGERPELPPAVAGSRLGELVRAVVADWPTVLAALDPADQDELVALVAEIGTREPTQARLALEDLLIRADLPREHPVTLVFRGAVRNTGTASIDSPEQIDAALRWLAASLSPEFVAATSIPSEPVTRTTVVNRIAAIAAYGPEEIAEPTPPELIRLRIGGAVRLPRFQFGADGRPDAVVLEVNRVLDAEHDPWGVAGWWLDRHSWLLGAPIELVDGTADDRRRVVVAAAAEVAD
jgi:hypothetical protein